ncbi:MAG: hypothetical protein SFZ02_06195 [bacterium]|nr:hypothetical protein [bacterium]
MFSADQLEYIIKVIRGIVDGMMSAGNSGMVGRAREMTAFTEYIKKATAQYGDNPLVGQLLDYGDALMDKSDFADPSELFSAMSELGDGLPQDDMGNGVRQFIYGLAEAVAGASGGGFLGRGDKISDDENDYLDFLRGKLGL